MPAQAADSKARRQPSPSAASDHWMAGHMKQLIMGPIEWFLLVALSVL